MLATSHVHRLRLDTWEECRDELLTEVSKLQETKIKDNDFNPFKVNTNYETTKPGMQLVAVMACLDICGICSPGDGHTTPVFLYSFSDPRWPSMTGTRACFY